MKGCVGVECRKRGKDRRRKGETEYLDRLQTEKDGGSELKGEKERGREWNVRQKRGEPEKE